MLKSLAIFLLGGGRGTFLVIGTIFNLSFAKNAIGQIFLGLSGQILKINFDYWSQ